MLKKIKQIGPGAMVAAAFIGPGTVTTATMAGASYGYTLLWAILFSVLATLLLQEMSARLGVVGDVGVGEALRNKIADPYLKIMAIVLVVGAVLVGNAAYEAGNITGAVLGFGDLLNPNWAFNPLIILIGLVAFFLLFSGKYILIERSLVIMVAVMGVVFLASAILLKPSISKIISGLFSPELPKGAALVVVGLIGTTVVPYNLFLHASSAKKKWIGEKDLPSARWDTVISVLLGGIITMCILITSAVAFAAQEKSIESAADLSAQLQPILGEWSSFFIAFGFLAAGLSSSVTAPLAAAFATSEVLGWGGDMRKNKFRAIWLLVLISGIVLSSVGWKPTTVILFAQVANGLLLPIIALFLLWVMNDEKIMGEYTNQRWMNLAGGLLILVALILGAKSILSALNLI